MLLSNIHPSTSFSSYILCYNTAEGRIAQLVNKITTTYGNIWRCTKGNMGNCWFDDCDSIIHRASYYCEENKNPKTFHTCLCHTNKFFSLLQSVNAKGIYDLYIYIPFNPSAGTLASTQTSKLKNEVECILNKNCLEESCKQIDAKINNETHYFK